MKKSIASLENALKNGFHTGFCGTFCVCIIDKVMNFGLVTKIEKFRNELC